jgi:chromosome partitioning protein
MAQVVSVINFKGGVGKTTTAVEIGSALAKHHGRKTLLVDLDPQASATFYVMEQKSWLTWKDSKGSTNDLFKNRDISFSMRNAIVPDVLQGKAPVIGFDLLPSTPDLIDIDLGLTDFISYNILQRYLDQVRNDYDYIICDCPPNFNPVTKNSLWASDAYIIPTVPDFLSTYGIGLLHRSVNKLVNPHAQKQQLKVPALGGIVLTRIRTNVTLHAAYCEQVRHDYPGNVFKHVVSDSIIVAGAPNNRVPVSVIPNPNKQEAHLQEQFKDLAGEFISRIHHIRPHMG